MSSYPLGFGRYANGIPRWESDPDVGIGDLDRDRISIIAGDENIPRWEQDIQDYEANVRTTAFRATQPTPFQDYIKRINPMSNLNKLTVFTPPLIKATTAPQPILTPPAEVCLKLTQVAGKVLLEIVDPETGRHETAGNLLNIWPDGTYTVIPGAKFGNNKERGFRNRNAS